MSRFSVNSIADEISKSEVARYLILARGNRDVAVSYTYSGWICQGDGQRTYRVSLRRNVHIASTSSFVRCLVSAYACGCAIHNAAVPCSTSIMRRTVVSTFCFELANGKASRTIWAMPTRN